MRYSPHKKIIDYHLIIALEKDLRQLDAWQVIFEELAVALNSDKSRKRRFSDKDFDVYLLIFNDFFKENQELLRRIRKGLNTMKTAEPIKPKPLQP